LTKTVRATARALSRAALISPGSCRNADGGGYCQSRGSAKSLAAFRLDRVVPARARAIAAYVIALGFAALPAVAWGADPPTSPGAANGSAQSGVSTGTSKPEGSQFAVAQSAGPAKSVDPSALKHVAMRPSAASIEEEEEDEPLSDIPSSILRQMKRQANVDRFTSLRSETQFGGSETADPAVQQKPGGNNSTLALNSLQNFTGPSNADQLDGFLWKPPDSNVAAGPNHLVMVINSLISIYSKAGAVISRSSATDWFSSVCAGCSSYDPRITYDPVAGHWLMLYAYKDTTSVSKVLLSVSQTSDPTGAWWIYALDGSLNFSGDNTWADYPDIGFDGIAAGSGGAVYITTNQYTFSDRTFRTASVYILSKTELYSGGSLNYWRASNRTNADASQAYSYRAVRTYGNPGGEFLINNQNNGSTVSIWRINPTYPPTAVDWTLQSTLSIGSYSVPPDAVQPGTTDLLDTLDNRFYNAVWRNNRLYGAFTTGYNWGSGTVAAIRSLKINTSSFTSEVNETYGADGYYYYSPAIEADSSDNFIVSFSRSNTSEYAGARYAGRLTADSGTGGSFQLKAGTVTLFKPSGAFSNRWGDYECAAVDPSDSSKVWIAGEFTANLGYPNDFNWSTWIAQVQFPSSGPPAPVAAAATSVTVSSFTANWGSSSGATGYKLDVSTSSSFASFVSGYQDLDVGNVLSRSVTGLSANTIYYYRVRAYSGSGTSGNSGTISLTTASAKFVINATFDASIVSNANAADIMATINQAVNLYQALYKDQFTASILFRYASTAPDGSPLSGGTLAQSSYVIYTGQSWNTVINAIKADASSTNDSTANSSLPVSALSTNIIIASANGRAIGLSTPPAMASNGSVGSGPYDGIVTLNSAQTFKFTRPVDASSYDALRSTEHEIDEVLGLGSFISKSADLRPQDLFSWSSAGTRNLTSSGTRYFSINSGSTNIVGFNQNASGDFGDWLSASCPQANPYVQNAFSCAGQSTDVSATSPEGINLDVIGYDLTNGGSAVGPPVAVVAGATSASAVSITWSAPSGTVPAKYHVYRSSNHINYSQVNGETTTGTSYSDTSASASTSYLYKVRSVDSFGVESPDSNLDLATTVIFTDPTLNSSTAIKQAHTTELRTAVNAVRTLAGLGAFPYTDSISSSTKVKRIHVIDLRTALDQARSTLTLSALSYADSTINIGSTAAKAIHFTELRNGVK
jgi:hypothetical protein